MHKPAKNAFIGIGWASPPTFIKGANEVMMSTDVQNINECLTNLLSTRLGERVLNHGYGTELSQSVFMVQSSFIASEIKESLERAIKLYEPRINDIQVTVNVDDFTTGVMSIHISYIVRKVNSRHNFVYPFYFNEGTFLEL